MALPSLAVVRLQDTQTLTGQAVLRREARLTQTLSLLRPAVHHAARKLIAGQELAGIGLISCGEKGEENVVDISIHEVCCLHLPLTTLLSPGGAEECLILMRSSASGLH